VCVCVCVCVCVAASIAQRAKHRSVSVRPTVRPSVRLSVPSYDWRVVLFDKKVTQSFELTIETASIRSDPFGPRVNKPVLYGHLQPCNRDLQNARPIFISLAASIAKSINHRRCVCPSICLSVCPISRLVYSTGV